MTTYLTEEDVVRIIEQHPYNTVAHLERVRRLLKSAYPGSPTWRILDREYGFVGDYDVSDEYQPNDPVQRI